MINTLASGMVRIVSCGEMYEVGLTKRPRPAEGVSRMNSFGELGDGAEAEDDDNDGDDDEQGGGCELDACGG